MKLSNYRDLILSTRGRQLSRVQCGIFTVCLKFCFLSLTPIKALVGGQTLHNTACRFKVKVKITQKM